MIASWSFCPWPRAEAWNYYSYDYFLHFLISNLHCALRSRRSIAKCSHFKHIFDNFFTMTLCLIMKAFVFICHFSSVLYDNGITRSFNISDDKQSLPSLSGYSTAKHGYILAIGRIRPWRTYDVSHFPVSRYWHIAYRLFISISIKCVLLDIIVNFMSTKIPDY